MVSRTPGADALDRAEFVAGFIAAVGIVVSNSASIYSDIGPPKYSNEVTTTIVLPPGTRAVLSPANSYGFMDGGIDAQYVERFGEAVVMVTSPAGQGSGFVVTAEGHLITNYHVV